MTALLDALSFEFMRNAIAAGVLASVLCGVIGTFVVVKRLTLISGGISHAAFGGLGVCYFFGVNPLLGAFAVAVASALGLGLAPSERLRFQDAWIGVIWAVGMAVGIVFIARTPGYAPNLMTYLFGNILTVSRGDVVMTAALVAGVLAVIAAFYKEFVAVSFDEVFATVQGVSVRVFSTVLLVMVALSVVLLIQVVGIILVIALLTIPPMIGLMLRGEFLGVMLISVTVGVAITLAGLGVSYYYDLPSGPAIILVGAAALVLTALTRRRRWPPVAA